MHFLKIACNAPSNMQSFHYEGLQRTIVPDVCLKCNMFFFDLKLDWSSSSSIVKASH